MSVEIHQGFNNNTFLSRAPPIRTGAPFTVFTWFHPDNVHNGALFEIGNLPPGFGGFHFYTMEITSSGELRFDRSDPTTSVLAGGTYTGSTWNTGAIVTASSTSAIAYLNAVAGATDTNNANPFNLNITLIGTRPTSTTGAYFHPYSGCYGYMALWDIALVQANIDELNSGVLPPDIAGGTLVSHLIMYLPGIDQATAGHDNYGADFTLNTNSGTITTCASEPPVTSGPINVNLVGVSAQGMAHSLTASIPGPAPPSPSSSTGLGPCFVEKIIPSYLYQEYNDDDDLQAFVKAYNTYGQAFLDWFNTLNLPIYTHDPVSGDLLDWVAAGLYGLTRPSLPSAASSLIGPYNTWDYNTLAYNELMLGTHAADFIITDDIFRRIITWHFYKGDCKVFDIRWLKRRIMRFLLGTDGIDFNVDQTYQVSVTFGPGNQVNINLINTLSSFVSGALYNTFGYNELPEYNGITSSVIALPPLPNESLLKSAVESGFLELPFQFTYKVNII